MCGITGFSWKEMALLKNMTDSITHRGPDDFGFFESPELSLGHRRLSIIDLSKSGKQPMKNEDNTIIISYNGEIYNFMKLKKKLEKNHKFISKTDTEVILHGYEEWGIEILKKLDGMFAFALFDKEKNKLILARDRLGIKPLYYSIINNEIIFSSEIKAILKSNKINKIPNKKAILDYLKYQNIFDNKTFFDGINILKPGNTLIFDTKNKTSVVKKYWEPNYVPKLDEQKKKKEAFKKLFNESVKKHLVSDVPVGVYLSGGFDSSAVAISANEHVKSKLKTFTGAFDEGNDFDERVRSRLVSKKINSDIYEKVITPQDFIDSINQITYHLDEPRVGMGAFPQYHVSKLVSKNVKVVLTGHGGDELFLGYAYHKAILLKEMIKKNPLNLINVFKKRSEIIPLLYYIFGPIINKDLKWGILVLFSDNDLKDLLSNKFKKSTNNYSPEKFLKDNYSKYNDLERIERIYLETYLPSLFIVEDKLGMAHSIEARIPFCSNDLIDFSLKTDIQNKLNNLELKYLIKNYLKKSLPKKFFNQKKMGFPTPLAKWFKGPLKKYIYDTLLSEKASNRDIFNKNKIIEILDKHCKGKKDYSFQIWSILSIELWFQTFID